jgi:hypothetical protein
VSSPLDEGLYSALMEPRRQKWQARAAAGGSELAVTYAVRRAAALARPYRTKLAGCGRRGLRVKCGCKGWRGVRLYTCRQHLLCGICRRARAKRLGQRVRAGLDAALVDSGPDRMLVLLTLTLQHSGDIEKDRRDLAEGWRRFYLALRRRWGKWPYVGVWEVTPGGDGLGHVHAHVAVVWPWRDWSVCRQLWLEACPQSTRITFVASRRDGRRSDPRSVANYLGKYLAKGMEAGEFSPELRSRVVAGLYNTRWLFSSRGFWQPFVPCCQACQQPIVSAQYRFRGAPWVPPVDGSTSPRGDPQLGLALPEPHERAGCRCP